jgi:hypothetical protein
MQRRHFLHTTLALAAAGAAGLATAAPARPQVEVWKTPSCGCCKDWIRHLEANGFEVKFHDVPNATKNDYRRRMGLADRFGSCHTALVGGYVIEGHVPARDIQRLLKDRPRALGLAVPGMPVGSPGMDGPEYNGLKDPYDVLLVQRDGTAAVFQSYR